VKLSPLPSSARRRAARHGQGEAQATRLYALVGISVIATRPRWMDELKVPGDTLVFLWSAGTDPDTYGQP
jgi:hypothetical protein